MKEWMSDFGVQRGRKQAKRMIDPHSLLLQLHLHLEISQDLLTFHLLHLQGAKALRVSRMPAYHARPRWIPCLALSTLIPSPWSGITTHFPCLVELGPETAKNSLEMDRANIYVVPCARHYAKPFMHII